MTALAEPELQRPTGRLRALAVALYRRPRTQLGLLLAAPLGWLVIAYLGSLGTQEMPGNSQTTQTDQFAKVNGCTITTLPTAASGKHVCTPYQGCKEGFPVTWCSYDGGHGFQDTDSGSSSTWVPGEVWAFLMPLLL